MKASEPGPEALRRSISNKVADLTERRCARFESLTNIADYGLHRTELRHDRKVLSKMGVARLVERVDLALETLERHKAALEEEHKDASALEVLEAISTKGDLSSLRLNRQRIDGLEFHGTQAKDIAGVKIDAIRAEIADLEAFAQALPERLDSLTRLDAIRSLKEEILRRRDTFEGSSEQDEVEHALERCSVLEGFFGELGKVQGVNPETPEKTDELLRSLDDLAADYGSTLSSAQDAVLHRVEDTLKQEATKQRQQAMTWLENREEDLDRLKDDSQGGINGSHLEELMERLEKPPAFLLPEAQGRYTRCSQEVLQLADQDKVGQVERHFKQIADRQKRLECLERLRQLVEEPE